MSYSGIQVSSLLHALIKWKLGTLTSLGRKPTKGQNPALCTRACTCVPQNVFSPGERFCSFGPSHILAQLEQILQRSFKKKKERKKKEQQQGFQNLCSLVCTTGEKNMYFPKLSEIQNSRLKELVKGTLNAVLL